MCRSSIGFGSWVQKGLEAHAVIFILIRLESNHLSVLYIIYIVHYILLVVMYHVYDLVDYIPIVDYDIV